MCAHPHKSRRRQGLGTALGSAVLLGLALAPGSAGSQEPEVANWVSELRQEALARNIPAAVFDEAMAGFAPIPRVIELDRKQPETTMTFARYLKLVVNDRRVRDGRRALARHGALLEEISQAYGVQARFIVALWGIESNFGSRTGSFSVVQSLATLAYDGRRGAFFRGELLDALVILQQGHVTAGAMEGSWAGAMGQPQFMPSSFLRYAVDHDGDGRKDIWGSVADTLASAASYLQQNGWSDDQTWGRRVRLPAGFDASLVGHEVRKALPAWQALGVRRADGRALPGVALRASVVRPDGEGGPAYLVYENFRVLRRWNRSDYFALAVGRFSDAVARRSES